MVLPLPAQEMASLDRAELEAAQQASFQDATETRSKIQFQKFVLSLKNATVPIVMTREQLRLKGHANNIPCGKSEVVKLPTYRAMRSPPNENIAELLPEEDPLPPGRYETCAVVGNSGSYAHRPLPVFSLLLIDQRLERLSALMPTDLECANLSSPARAHTTASPGCLSFGLHSLLEDERGPEIDEHDAVFRFNAAKITGALKSIAAPFVFKLLMNMLTPRALVARLSASH